MTRCQRCQSSPRRKSPTLWATPVLLAGCAKIPVIYLHCPYSSTHFISFYVVLSLSDKPNYHIKLIIYIPLKYILLNFHYIHMFPKYFWLKSQCSHKRMDPLTEILSYSGSLRCHETSRMLEHIPFIDVWSIYKSPFSDCHLPCEKLPEGKLSLAPRTHGIGSCTIPVILICTINMYYQCSFRSRQDPVSAASASGHFCSSNTLIIAHSYHSL